MIEKFIAQGIDPTMAAALANGMNKVLTKAMGETTGEQTPRQVREERDRYRAALVDIAIKAQLGIRYAHIGPGYIEEIHEIATRAID